MYDLSGFIYVRGIALTGCGLGTTFLEGSSSRTFKTTLPMCLPDPMNLENKKIYNNFIIYSNYN